MRVVIQRVKKSSVTIDNKVYNSIDNGLMVLVGFTEEDLNSKVLFKKTEMTLFEYFEYSKLLENVPLGNQVELSVDVAGFEAGDMLTTEEFIHVIVYHCATKIGEMSLQEIIDKYVKEMHLVSIANNKKNGFSLKNLFGMKK